MILNEFFTDPAPIFTRSLWGWGEFRSMMQPPPLPHSLVDRTEADLELDLAVALRIEGYRWVTWDAGAMGATPLYEPGRFIDHPGGMLAHHHVPAPDSTPLAENPYRRLPHYSVDASLALRAAERAGLFRSDGVRLSSSNAGRWQLGRTEGGLCVEGDSLPKLLCRASLRWADEHTAHGEEL